MILLKLKAGLGNQMFQYAYARALSLRSSKAYGENIPLTIDTSWYGNQSKKDTPRHYGLTHFNIDASVTILTDATESAMTDRPFLASHIATYARKIIDKLKRDFLGFSDFVYYPSMCTPRKSAYIENHYFNSEKYFIDYEDIIRKEFTLKDPLGTPAQSIADALHLHVQDGVTPVLLHIRRGDYVSNPYAHAFHGAQSADYFNTALTTLLSKMAEQNIQNLHCYIVSDDVSWVKENIHPTYTIGGAIPVTYISRPEIADYEEIHLMSLCHHFIISNSTFSWFGAWLSKAASKLGHEKIVVGPKKWVADFRVDTSDVMPTDWIRV